VSQEAGQKAMNKMLYAYEMGIDCGRNGPNNINCHHTIFSEEFYTLAWDLGKEKGMLETEKPSVPLEYGQRDRENGLLVIRCEEC